MAAGYSLTPEARIKLKQPLGSLIRGTFSENMKRLKEIKEREKPAVIISVGDIVSKNLVENKVPRGNIL